MQETMLQHASIRSAGELEPWFLLHVCMLLKHSRKSLLMLWDVAFLPASARYPTHAVR